jgi:Secretion system C-terminal sorting domain/SprB repeat
LGTQPSGLVFVDISNFAYTGSLQSFAIPAGITTITQPVAIRLTNSVIANESCNGGATGEATATALGGTSPYTYSWSPGGRTTSTASGLSAGTYTVHVTSHAGCTETATVIITQPAALRDSISSSTSLLNLITATVGVKGGTAPYTYSWSACGGTKATMTGLSAGTYTITIHDNHDCSSTLIAKLSCAIVDGPVKDTSNSQCCLGGIDNVNLYPNPNSGQFKIAGIEPGMIIEIYDYTGRKISVISATGETMQLNISNETNGIYLIRILDKNGNLVSEKKVVKIK